MAKEKPFKAFTLIELLVIIGILILFAALIAPPTYHRHKHLAGRNACANNLRRIGVALKTWALDHTNQLPTSTAFGGSQQYSSEAFRHFQAMSNELVSPLVVLCPADTRPSANDFGSTFSNSNISYFAALDVTDDQPQMFLAGDRNLTNGSPPRNGILTLTTNSVVGWTHEMHRGFGQVLLGDGSVQQTSSSYLGQLVRNSGGTNRLAMP